MKETHKATRTYEETTDRIDFKRNDVVVVVVACRDRLQETLTMLKSALMFSKEKLNFVVFAEDELIESFSQKLGEWKLFTNNGFTYKVMALTFPSKDAEEWKKLFKPCAAQRLFLPNILKEVDSVLYVDTDTLFLTPVETIWNYFHKMNSSQMAALAPEHEDPNVGWYNRFARHPYYGKLGVNSGVMLMNLTRMRVFQWSKLYLYSCRYNFRPDHCMYMSVCKPAEKEGVAVIHGSRGFFHSEKQPVFQAIYRAFEEVHKFFQLGGDLFKEFYQPLESYLDQAENTNCGHIKEVFLKNIRRYIDIDYNNT
ncbi:glucoside xylosyltransferase 2, partial [Asbolus verrucosus]